MTTKELINRFRNGTSINVLAELSDCDVDIVQETLLLHGLDIKSAKIDKSEWYDYYVQGLSDGEIAEIVGYSKKTVNKWRRDEGLPLHEAVTPQSTNWYDYYVQGLTDAEIAQKIGYTKRTVNNWRRAKGLPYN